MTDAPTSPSLDNQSATSPSLLHDYDSVCSQNLAFLIVASRSSSPPLEDLLSYIEDTEAFIEQLPQDWMRSTPSGVSLKRLEEQYNQMTAIYTTMADQSQLDRDLENVKRIRGSEEKDWGNQKSVTEQSLSISAKSVLETVQLCSKTLKNLEITVKRQILSGLAEEDEDSQEKDGIEVSGFIGAEWTKGFMEKVEAERKQLETFRDELLNEGEQTCQA